MTDLRTRRPNGRDWRAFLTPEERRKVAALDKFIAKTEKPTKAARLERQVIQNRATVRAFRNGGK